MQKQLFKSYVDTKTLEQTCDDKRLATVNRELTHEQMNEIKDSFYLVDREITERSSLQATFKHYLNENISPGLVASKIFAAVSESKHLTDSGLKKLLKDKQELTEIIESGHKKSEELCYLITNLSKMKTGFYDSDGYLVEVRDSNNSDVTIFTDPEEKED